ncbi:MAG: Spy/CpxP family protein refolding chaperone [Betaproteobacteria bacterium]|nr:Spy/CpxP family protein refolding chaperone [Betaproteobacteria bacterium]
MKRLVKTSLIAALAATTLLSGAAMAYCGGHGWGGGQGWRKATPEQVKERMTQKREVHLARLELALALTPDQKSAWADFKKAAEARTDAMLKEMENKRNAKEPKTALERIDRAEEYTKKRATMLADMRKPVETFYGKLSAAQKTVFDAEFAGFMKGKKRGGGYGGGYGCMAGEPGSCYDGGGHPGKGGGRGKR